MPIHQRKFHLDETMLSGISFRSEKNTRIKLIGIQIFFLPPDPSSIPRRKLCPKLMQVPFATCIASHDERCGSKNKSVCSLRVGSIAEVPRALLRRRQAAKRHCGVAPPPSAPPRKLTLTSRRRRLQALYCKPGVVITPRINNNDSVESHFEAAMILSVTKRTVY